MGGLPDALDVHVRVAAHLQLEPGVPLPPVPGDLGRHLVRRLLRDGPVEPHRVAVAAAQQHADGQPGRLPEDVPAGDVDAALDVGVPFQGGVHAVVELQQFPRVVPDQVWGEFPQPCPHAVGVGRQVERSERANLAVAHKAGVGFDTDDGAVEHRDRLTARPLVVSLPQRQLDAVGEDANDFHESGLR